MEKINITARFDISCKWSGEMPRYRVYVEEELFCERDFTCKDAVMREFLHISASSGVLEIQVHLCNPQDAVLTTQNHHVDTGNGVYWIDNNRLKIPKSRFLNH